MKAMNLLRLGIEGFCHLRQRWQIGQNRLASSYGPVLLLTIALSLGTSVWAQPQPAGLQVPVEQAVTTQSYLDRAMAFIRNARESGHDQYYQQAEWAVQQVLKQEPDSADALRLLAWAQAGNHDFEASLKTAQRLSHIEPDDYRVYALLGDAHVELGAYEQAVSAWQRMMDLKPGPAAYSRVAMLRELHGDPEGAIEMMAMAVRSVGTRDPEALAWLLVEYGTIHFEQGQLQVAERAFDKALEVFPNYHKALVALAEVKTSQEHYAQAIQLYQTAVRTTPELETIVALGDLYELIGQPKAAAVQYDLVEFLARLHQLNTWSGNQELARYYADQGKHVDTAVALMEAVASHRRDIHTYGNLAWVYYKAGRLTDAQVAIQQALRLGTQDAVLWYHAGLIAYELGQVDVAQTQLQRAITINPHFSPVDATVARQLLAQLKDVSLAGDVL